jgi:uncharacterized protein
MTRKALVTWGGWPGHQPREVAELFAGILRDDGMQVEISDTLDCFADPEALKSLDLIVPVWTMSKIDAVLVDNVAAAVTEGVGLAGCHGGMCDAFRENVVWQFMTGSQWVAHPGNDGVDYTVKITDNANPLVAGIADFAVKSEQYYLHVDPAVQVLATTEFPLVAGPHTPNGIVQMPIAYTKMWGKGRVYYNALGHQVNVIDHGAPLEMLKRGLIWASGGRG